MSHVRMVRLTSGADTSKMFLILRAVCSFKLGHSVTFIQIDNVNCKPVNFNKTTL